MLYNQLITPESLQTLQSLEVTRMMLAGGKYRGIVASTIPEIKGALPLVKEGILDEVRIPPQSSKIEEKLNGRSVCTVFPFTPVFFQDWLSSENRYVSSSWWTMSSK